MLLGWQMAMLQSQQQSLSKLRMLWGILVLHNDYERNFTLVRCCSEVSVGMFF